MSSVSLPPRGGWVFDLAVGESAEVPTADGPRRLTLLNVIEPRCRARGVIRFPRVEIDLDGERAEIPAALYHMPQPVNGLRVACSVTRGVAEVVSRHMDVYALEKDARLRCWPADGPLLGPQPLTYPARQRWFATMTQMANERCFVDAGEAPLIQPGAYIYHHYGLDIGGHDRAVPVVAAAAGVVVVRGEEQLPDHDGAGGQTRYDRVVIRDEFDWRYLYSHLDMIAPTIRLGERVEAGDLVGVLGKEGASGGWSHLHFGVCARQPSGRYGQVEAYPLLVEAYLNERPGALLAVARPHRVAVVGEPVELDGSRSLCDEGDIAAFQWTLHDGEIVNAPKAVKIYDKEGVYSEMLTVTDARGRTAVDFCPVEILPEDGDPARTPPIIQLTYYPTDDLRPGQPIAFKARTFWGRGFEDNADGQELWDFGDGSQATTCSGAPGRGTACAPVDFAERWHAFERPGRYIVTVRRRGKNGLWATAQTAVEVAGA